HASHYSSSYPSPAPSPSDTSIPAPRVRTAPSSPSVVSTRTTSSKVVLSENFDGATMTRTKWRFGVLTAGTSFTDRGVRVVEQSGRLEITPRKDAAARSYNGYLTVSPWDFTAAHARVEVPQTTEGTADTIFAVGTDNNNWFGFIVESGKLYMQSKINGRK